MPDQRNKTRICRATLFAKLAFTVFSGNLMKKIFFISGVLFLIIVLGKTVSQIGKMNITVTNSYEEIVVKNKQVKNVNRLYCKITGKVTGLVEIDFLVDDGTTRKTISENGKIKFVYNADWYADDFTVKIMPQNNASGYLNIIYKFSAF
jgi:hypothetical protein